MPLKVPGEAWRARGSLRATPRCNWCAAFGIVCKYPRPAYATLTRGKEGSSFSRIPVCMKCSRVEYAGWELEALIWETEKPDDY